MVKEVEPDRDAVIDFEETTPVSAEAVSLTDHTVEAPYGYKKDGTPAKKRGRPAGSTNTGGYTKGPRGPRSLENQIGAMLFTFNIPLSMFLPRDALGAEEVQALAHAIDQECQRSPRFKKYVENALKVQGGTSLALVVAAIIGRRVVRHNLIEVPQPIGNDGADAMLGSVIMMTTGKGAFDPNLFNMSKQDAQVS